ncbi:hypothetical protein [Duganella sp. CY15W]|uniref:hypothetical protein n=1 Tax=Duganella sp. CY15W TaxID=2692172 RepID=UPI001925FD41|nr:hypothetical protein [Duganella sp. CY15W]
MDWTPISEVELWDLVIKAESRMSPELSRLWQVIKIPPQKWSAQSHGLAGGFWVVALVGENAIWYNDIEEGFNRSSYRHVGTLDEYICNQDDLEDAVQGVLVLIESGIDTTPHRSAPVAGVYQPHGA